MSKKKKRTVASFREKQFAKSFVRNKGDQQKAAKEAYNPTNNNSASVMGHEIAKRPRVRREIKRLQEALDITDVYLAEKLKDGLESYKPYYNKETGAVEMLKDTGERRHHLELAHKMRGDMDEHKTVEKREMKMQMTAEMSYEDLVSELESLKGELVELSEDE